MTRARERRLLAGVRGRRGRRPDPGRRRPDRRPARPHLKLTGANLSPGGPVLVKWTAGEDELKSFGFSTASAWFTPTSRSRPSRHDLRREGLPAQRHRDRHHRVHRRLAEGPGHRRARSRVGPRSSFIEISGSNLVIFGSKPTVAMTKGGTTIEATLFGGQPGFKGKPDLLLVRVPTDAEDGTYDVTVKVGDQTSNSQSFEVGDQPLSVDQLAPKQGRRIAASTRRSTSRAPASASSAAATRGGLDRRGQQRAEGFVIFARTATCGSSRRSASTPGIRGLRPSRRGRGARGRLHREVVPTHTRLPGRRGDGLAAFSQRQRSARQGLQQLPRRPALADLQPLLGQRRRRHHAPRLGALARQFQHRVRHRVRLRVRGILALTTAAISHSQRRSPPANLAPS